MKNVLLLIGLLSCLVFEVGCSKDTSTSVKSQIVGNWELRNIQGSFFGPGGPPDVTPGNGNRWMFSDTVYHIYSRGQLTNSGSYTLTQMDTYGGVYPPDALVLDKNTYSAARISIVKDTLTMYVGAIAADGYIAKYIRQ